MKTKIKKEHKTMAEYIERKKFIRKLNYICKTYGFSKVITEKFKNAINDSIAADVVEVVRCKDCEMARETEDERYFFCMQFADTVGFRAFCSYGEKKGCANNG